MASDKKIINKFGFGYVLTRKKVKNINIRIKSDGIVYISAPYSERLEYIEKILSDNSGQIIKSIEKIKRNSEEKNKIPEYLKFLGNRYKIIFTQKNIEFSGIVNNTFEISTRAAHDFENITIILKNWQMKQCRKLYSEMNKLVYNDFIRHGYDVPHAEIHIKDMKSRWGSCNYVKGKISMNLRLCEYETDCIFSVFYHEYMHFIHPDHSKAFYNDLVDIFPNYMICHKKLKESG